MANLQTITLGGGCFWCLEAVYELVDGVAAVEVLEIFFHIHDPTTLNRQGNDVGTQYRSGIYVESAEQERVAREVLAEANAAHGGRVVTELKPLADYSKAEAYHQHYFVRNPGQGYCAFVVAPKVEKFRKTFRQRVKAA
jgi:peptide-methionine (S)-S-oxide reductase